MEQLKVKHVIISKQMETNDNYEIFKEIVKNKKVSVVFVGVPEKYEMQKLEIEKNLYLDILWPRNSKIINDNILNNNSIVCKLNYLRFSMLFTGDIEEISEKEILKEYENNLDIIKSTILKVAHHGSKTSSSQEFLNAVKPKIALIGVGENNKFGHPNKEVLERLEKLRCKNIPNRPNGRNNNYCK